MEQFSTPVLFIIFNREDTAQKVFDAIKSIKPSKLYIASDGPRSSKQDEALICQKIRGLILSQIDWPCSVYTLFRDTNLGCKKAVSSSIDWFFENEEMGIILEDDCLPSQSFFLFAQELLIKYKDEPTIGMISGNNFIASQSDQFSYYFSRYCHIWGWATWRRAWLKYDINMSTWHPELFKGKFSNKAEFSYWNTVFKNTFENRIDTWDYQWVFTCFLQNFLSITPEKNLVENIGFDSRATHTTTAKKIYLQKANELTFPLKHPTHLTRNQDKDKINYKLVFSPPSLAARIFLRIKKILTA